MLDSAYDAPAPDVAAALAGMPARNAPSAEEVLLGSVDDLPLVVSHVASRENDAVVQALREHNIEFRTRATVPYRHAQLAFVLRSDAQPLAKHSPTDRALAPMRRCSSASSHFSIIALSSPIESTSGSGTMWLRRNQPIWPSTPPFSWAPLKPGWQ